MSLVITLVIGGVTTQGGNEQVITFLLSFSDDIVFTFSFRILSIQYVTHAHTHTHTAEVTLAAGMPSSRCSHQAQRAGAA